MIAEKRKLFFSFLCFSLMHIVNACAMLYLNVGFPCCVDSPHGFALAANLALQTVGLLLKLQQSASLKSNLHMPSQWCQVREGVVCLMVKSSLPLSRPICTLNSNIGLYNTFCVGYGLI